jgi:exodeoxyribonuclease V alpha subunit
MFDERIVGSVERIVYRNQENGYHVLSVLSRETGKECTVTANLLKIHEGVTMEFQGQWVSNPRFGTQFKAEKAIEVAPETKEALIRYLSSSFFKGIGPVIAKKIVGHFEDNTLEVLKTDIDRLAEVPGISKKKIGKIKESWIENSEINEIMVFLQSYNISTLYSVRVYETYGRDCVNKIRENPYRLIDDIKGINFKSADVIALDMGFAIDGEFRIAAGLKYALNQNENEGHCYLTQAQIVENTANLLGIVLNNNVYEVLNKLVDNHEIKVSTLNNETRYYSIQMYYDERYVAKKIGALNRVEDFFYDEDVINDWIKITQEGDIKLSEEQINGILGIIRNSVSILTGNPGCGKTVTLNFLLKLLDMTGQKKYLLMSPTGKSARVLEAVTGCEAATIHRTLGVDFNNGGFIHNEFNQFNISNGFIIVDETSMVDIRLAASLLKAIPSNCQVLFVGDSDQLPSVSAGNFFRDLINSGVINVFRLNKIFRQGKGSEIIQYIHEINNGIVPEIPSPLVDPELWKSDVDCMFIDTGEFDPYKSKEDYPDWHSLYYGVDTMEMLRRLYVDIIPKYYGKEREIQILSPQNIGFGSEKINKIIQESANPPSINKAEIEVGKTIFRVNDRVLQTQNNYSEGMDVMNGDTGKIISVNPETKELVVEFENGKIVEYKKESLLELKLGFSFSVHKSQGAQFEIVILPILKQNWMMLYRNLLYTACSRSKSKLIIIGQREMLAQAIRNNKIIQRQTSLIELLRMQS